MGVDREDCQGVRCQLADRTRYATAETVPRYRPRARPVELTKAQAAHVTRRLGAHPELRATTLYREVRELGDVGSYPSFARRVRVLRPVDPQADPQVRFETGPGVQVQADWADCGQWLVGEQLCPLHALVAVLGFSRMVAVRFATDTTRPPTLWLLTECLVDLGGAPTELLTDRDPALVIGSTPSGRAVFAPEGSTWPRCSACARGRVGRTGPRPRARSNGSFASSRKASWPGPRASRCRRGPCWPTTTAWRRGGALRWWRPAGTAPAAASSPRPGRRSATARADPRSGACRVPRRGRPGPGPGDRPGRPPHRRRRRGGPPLADYQAVLG